MGKGFDEYAPAYDAWFLENRNVLYSEINLVAHVLKNPGRTLPVGHHHIRLKMPFRRTHAREIDAVARFPVVLAQDEALFGEII